MVWAPLSEVPQIGRMPIYILTLAVFVVLQVPTALATNYGMLMAFRFLTGFFGSPILATGGATVADLYSPKKRAYGMTLWGVFATCAPSLGPLLGSFSARFEGWRWTIWELMWLSSATLVFLFFFYPETSASNILYRRARRLRKATGNSSIMSAPEIALATISRRDLAVDTLVRPFALNFQEPIVFALNVYIGLIYALLYIWFESFPVVFIGIYHWREQLLGLSFLGLFVGAFLVMPPFFAYLYYVQEPKYNENGELKPEERMPVAIVGALLVPICLFWFGWTSRPSVHWIVPIIGSSLFSIAALLLFVSLPFYTAAFSHQRLTFGFALTTERSLELSRRRISHLCRERSGRKRLHSFHVRRRLPALRESDVRQPRRRLGKHPPCASRLCICPHPHLAIQVRRTHPHGQQARPPRFRIDKLLFRSIAVHLVPRLLECGVPTAPDIWGWFFFLSSGFTLQRV
jgi:multidrug resistance protein